MADDLKDRMAFIVLILTVLFSISGRGEEVDRWLKYGGGGMSVLMDSSCDLLTYSSLSVFTLQPSQSSQAAQRGRTVNQPVSPLCLLIQPDSQGVLLTHTEHTHLKKGNKR